MRNDKLVSIIIPTYNSEKTLERCLDSIRNQTYYHIELIVVDKNSTDSTAILAKSFKANVFVINAKERSEQINHGIKKANGKYIYRVDSDFILDPSLVEAAVNACENECYDAICVHNTSDPSISFWSKVRKLERDCYIDDELNVAARFFMKSVIKRIGGFNESLIAAEDYDFHNRLIANGFRIGRIKPQEVHIGEPKSLWEIAKKHYYYGTTINEFIKLNHSKGINQLSPIRPAFISHWKDFFKEPHLALGFIIYQAVRYSSAGLGYLVSKLNA